MWGTEDHPLQGLSKVLWIGGWSSKLIDGPIVVLINESKAIVMWSLEAAESLLILDLKNL